MLLDALTTIINTLLKVTFMFDAYLVDLLAKNVCCYRETDGLTFLELLSQLKTVFMPLITKISTWHKTLNW